MRPLAVGAHTVGNLVLAIDVAPSILELAGMSTPKSMDGRRCGGCWSISMVEATAANIRNSPAGSRC